MAAPGAAIYVIVACSCCNDRTANLGAFKQKCSFSPELKPNYKLPVKARRLSAYCTCCIIRNQLPPHIFSISLSL